jgi:ribosomal-protein-alanine N-acetyltransferase
MSPKPKLILRYMTMDDLPQVVRIDNLAFDLPWSVRSYEYEIGESPNSYMVVLEAEREKPLRFWERWLPALNGNERLERRVVGYGGLWYISGEAHISTIAVHPRLRGRGWGEILLAGMVRRSIMLEASELGLEVRVSNTLAQSLYRKYEFRVAAVKPEYYRNNDEDAYDMRVHLDDRAMLRRFQARYDGLLVQHGFEDHYSASESPPKFPPSGLY